MAARVRGARGARAHAHGGAHAQDHHHASRAFEAELRRIRSAGYAIDDEEQFEGLRCIAMPVFCYTGDVIASMCVVGPKHRMTHQKLTAVRVPLARLSRRLSERLGAGPDA